MDNFSDILQVFDQLSSAETEMKAKHLRQILKWASQFIRILKAEPKVSVMLREAPINVRMAGNRVEI